MTKNTRVPTYKKAPPREDWRPKKKNDPDPGSYESATSYMKVVKRPATATISKSKIKSFNELASHSKKFVPDPGFYDYEK